MTNRKYIDQINIFIERFVDKEKKEKGFVDSVFFRSEALKNKVENILNIMIDNGMFPIINNEKFNEFYSIAIKEVKSNSILGINPSKGLSSEEVAKDLWLTKEKIVELGWESDKLNSYRNRYMQYLKKIGRADSYIEATKRSSLAIVQKLGNPNSSESFYRRGLVVGSVQSGKTANFNAVINSAVDAGYGLIIVLSGIMEDLRKQTQIRIEKEVEGKHIHSNVFIGVGEVASFGTLGEYKEVQQVVLPTSIDTDFKKNIKEVDFSLNNKNILVCKKNTSVLKNLLLWLDNYLNENRDKIDIPLLIVDDEADNASLNNLGHKGKEYASTINGHIRALLALFNKKTYLGYTATPFGNVLQDRNIRPDEKWVIKDGDKNKEFDQESSLFPHDFIELLFPPTNYIGAKHFFETRLDEVKKIDALVYAVDDYIDIFPSRVFEDTIQPTTQKGRGTRATKAEDPFPPKDRLPTSLKEAIRCFVISTAIRISREKEMRESKFFQPHNTMLIHVSRFTSWQIETAKSVQKYVDELEEALNNDNPNRKLSIYSEFELTWYKYYADIMENIKGYLPENYEDDYLTPRTYHDIKKLLISAISGMEVKAINSETKESLDYSDKEPKKYIAIGGNRLSRGFTLEGLTINYFIRNTNFADTLLQMGRWFGYRPGYIDCCKIFATPEGLAKFDQTTLTIEDLEQKFIEMNRQGVTPKEYSLRVLKHPGVLKITRPSILKNTKEVKWSYSDHLIQTTKFHIEHRKIEKAWSAFKSHISSIDLKIRKNKKGEIEYLVYELDTTKGLFEFLNLPHSFYDPTPNNELGYFSNLEEYIKLCNSKNKLRKWSIVIKASGRGSLLKKEQSNLSEDIYLTQRGGFEKGSRWFKELKEHHLFTAGGSSSNILGGGQDMQIRLDNKEIEEATKAFREERFKALKEKYPDLTDNEIQKKIGQPPEKVFRRKMSQDEGVLVIYLMDLEAIFKYKNREIESLKDTLDTSIPLIGYAIGISEISSDIGGEYLEYFNEDEEVEACDEFDLEDIE